MKFEDLNVWKEARLFYQSIYKIVSDKSFKDYFFKDQILKASLSISNNIAEGFERQTNKELVRFFYISRGSCGEVRSMLYIAKDSGYIDSDNFENLIDKSKKISIMLHNYIKKVVNT